MNKLRIYFAISSVVFLFVLAISPLKDFFSEWRGYQLAYNEIIKELPQRIQPVDIGIKQLWVRKLDVVDRCTTCHLGLKEKALVNAKEPFRSHPHIYHDFEEFGCTICHNGQGSATSYKESKGKVKYWDKPIFPREYMEASCGKCHKEQVVIQAPILSLGRKLINEYNCAGCHKLEGRQRQWVPSLNGIGSKVNRSWLVNWLKNPKAYFATAKMPNFQLSDDEANTIADFLMTFKSFSNNAILEPLPSLLIQSSESQTATLVEIGSTRLRESRCISCHPFNGKGGYVATDLGKVASKVNLRWLYNYIKNPKHFQPNVEMPRYRFNNNDLTGVVAYMNSEYVDFDMAEPPSHTPDPLYYEKGLVLVKKYNCRGCHEIENIKNSEELGPDLSFIGSKKLYEIDFGLSGISQSLSSYIFTKLKSPRTFSSKMKMPNYELSDEQAQAIAVALLGNTSEQIPEELKIKPKPASTFTPQGKFGKLVNDLACFGCHTMFGRGRLVATDLTLEASMAKQEWIDHYFKVPYSLRPILTERMPNLFLSDDEIKTLVDYMEKVFIADSLTNDILINEATVAKGKLLYSEKYGCGSCHQINGKGGFVGPTLDKVASRLQPGWILHWLKNPQAYKPESIEPNNNFTDHEAEAITAYLMTLH
ncbi:MAG: c-type cytochrome [Bacteroidota bacterium]|nr:c-type cytochrome [Bacteroidota bacterium]